MIGIRLLQIASIYLFLGLGIGLVMGMAGEYSLSDPLFQLSSHSPRRGGAERYELRGR